MLNRHESRTNVLVVVLLIIFLNFIVLRNAWLSDDAYITFRTVENVLNGYGLVWNISERVQAYSHPLWMFLLVVFSNITRDLYYTTIALSLSLTILTVLILTFKIARTYVSALLALVILVLSRGFVDYSTSGLENVLTHLLLALFFWVYLKFDLSHKTLLLLSFIAALCTLNRMDTLLLVAPAIGYYLFQLRDVRAIITVFVGFLPFIIWELFSLVYYGFLFPNTAYAKLNLGISRLALMQQGMFYYLASLKRDPITLIGIILGTSVPFVLRDKKLLIIGAGIAAYLIYVVWIGGDFMMSRFFSAPLVCAVILTSQLPIKQMSFGLLLFMAALLGLTLTGGYPSTFSMDTDRTNVPTRESSGVADERLAYLDRELVNASRLTGQELRGSQNNSELSTILACGGLGVLGFTSSPNRHIIDVCALSDPLLARLPIIFVPNWRVGHYFRTVPEGYIASVDRNKNLLVDSQLAAYYDKLVLITRGDIWNLERLKTIVSFNLGQYDHLIDMTSYKYPYLSNLSYSDQVDNGPEFTNSFENNVSDFFGSMIPTLTEPQGLHIAFNDTRHDEFMELGTNINDYQIIYSLEDGTDHTQSVTTAYIDLAGSQFSVVQVPWEVQQKGYREIKILPQMLGEFSLAEMVLYSLDLDKANAPRLEQLLHLYLYSLAHGYGDLGEETLSLLNKTTPEQWQQLTMAELVALRELDYTNLHTHIDPILNIDLVLVDEHGEARVNVLGYDNQATKSDLPINQRLVSLLFEPASPLAYDYKIWFHVDETDQTKHYDRYPDEPTSGWDIGRAYTVQFPIEVSSPYEISFGFVVPDEGLHLYVDWPPEGDQDEYNVSKDSAWITLEEQPLE
jgi:arabinofuranosyltransferase